MCLFLQGFIRICCCQSCVVEYHITCWKAYKMSSFSEKNEKVHFELHLYLQACLLSLPPVQMFFNCDFYVTGLPPRAVFDSRLHRTNLQYGNLWPDRPGEGERILSRWREKVSVCLQPSWSPFFLQFKETIPKAVKPKKPKLAQKCTRLKKLKSKEEHLIKGKRHKQACQETEVTNSEVLQQKEDSACQSQEKGKKMDR